MSEETKVTNDEVLPDALFNAIETECYGDAMCNVNGIDDAVQACIKVFKQLEQHTKDKECPQWCATITPETPYGYCGKCAGKVMRGVLNKLKVQEQAESFLESLGDLKNEATFLDGARWVLNHTSHPGEELTEEGAVAIYGRQCRVVYSDGNAIVKKP